MGEEQAPQQAAPPQTIETGDVVWCRVAGRPWWPCVAFASWDDVQQWELPVSGEDRPSLATGEFVACFLKHYELAVFSADDARPWEDVPTLETCDEAVQKQLLAAIGEARALNARRLHSHRPHSADKAPLRLPRSGATTETWDACLFAVRDLERSKDVRATLARALRLALESKAPVEVVDGLRQCVGAEDHNIARLRALGILQDALGAPFADELQPNAPQLSDLLSERLVDAGDVLVLEIGGVESVRGEIDREGRVVYGGNAFRTVEGFVDKATATS